MDEESVKAYWNWSPEYEAFYNAWKTAEWSGQCDAWGSTEWRRVVRAWICDGWPVDGLTAFIRREANMGPLGH